MLVHEIINKIENKELNVKALAEMFNVSDRTIQNKIKNLGYKWDSKKAKYEYVGENKEPSNIEFKTLFEKKAPKKVNKSVGESKIKVNASTNKSNIDMIDYLLASKSESKPKRTYRGFYFDEDVLHILDNVNHGNKSDLINEVLRKVFKDKGLL